MQQSDLTTHANAIYCDRRAIDGELQRVIDRLAKNNAPAAVQEYFGHAQIKNCKQCADMIAWVQRGLSYSDIVEFVGQGFAEYYELAIKTEE